ncbi:MAG: hypothetical protein Fur0028_11860 [Bacteroidales bacterium]
MIINFEAGYPLTIPGFSKQEAIVESLHVFPPNEMPVEKWYKVFESSILDALSNKKCLPIFRSSHGEFSFVLGKVEIPKEDLWKRIRFYGSRIFRTIKYQSVFYSGTPGYGYETYKQWLLPKLREEYAQYLKWISEVGFLCMYFADRDAYPIRLQKEYLEWLQARGIRLDEKNYAHIYFVYGFFNGPHKNGIYKDRNILIVNSNESIERNKSIELNLKKLGAKDVRYLPISRTNSMLDNIIPPSDFDPDLCLVGAGVGAAKMIYQLRTLNCPIVDVGFILDTLADPNYLKRRIYCVHDDLWDEIFGQNLPTWASSFQKK